MQLFRSEAHAWAWEAQHASMHGEVLTLEQALAVATFVGKDRPQFMYTHPRATGAWEPFVQSLGLMGAWWQPQ